MKRNKPVKYNLIGKQFGQLKVLEQTRCPTTDRIAWKCVCNCGNSTIVLSQSLRRGSTRSCGCGVGKATRKRQLLKIPRGRRFGKLKVLGFFYQNQRGSQYFKCTCDCGKIHVTLGTRLKSGRTKSCGCGQLESVTTHGLSYTPEYYKAATYKRRALQKKNGGNFTAGDLVKLFGEQEGKCFYCNKSLRKEYHVDHKTPLSRGGSNEILNICLACPKCNLTKHTMTEEEFKEKKYDYR